jgi:prophage regulatory protein
MHQTDRLLRRTEVEQRCGITRASIYRLMRQGAFPLPLKIGPKAVRWPQSEIEDWLSERPRATGEHRG